MSGPYDFGWSKPQAVTTQDPIYDFGWSKKQQPEQANQTQGFLDYMGNFAKHLFLPTGQEVLQQQIAQYKGLDASYKFSELPGVVAVKDLGQMFNQVFDIATAGDIPSITAKIARGTASLFDGPSTTLGQKANGALIAIVKPVTDLAELSTGTQLTGDDVRQLTPEEKADRIKNSVAFLVAGKVGSKLAEATSIARTGGLATRILANAEVGGGAGAAYGFVSSANQQDQLAQTITGGVMGATLGVAFGTWSGKKTATPQEIQQTRQIQIENNSIAENVQLAQALSTSDDIAEAILNGKIGLSPNDIHVVPGISPGKIGTLMSNVPEGYRSALHVDGDGFGRLLVYGEQALTAQHERITNAAIRLGDRYFEGENHYEAARMAERAGIDRNNPSLDFEVGFKTNAGRFVNDNEAYRIGLANSQIPADTKFADISSEVFRYNNPDFGVTPPDELGMRRLISGEFKNLSSKLDERFFEKTGFIKGQLVGYNGSADWKIRDIGSEPNTLKLQNEIDGNVINVHKNDVQLPPHIGDITEKSAEVIQRLYDEFKDSVKPANEDVAQANNEKYGLIGFDETPPEEFVDRVPEVEGIKVLSNVNDFLASKGFNADEIKSLSKQLQLKTMKEAYAQLIPEDQELVSKANTEATKELRTSKQQIRDYKSLDRFARSNGYRITDAGSGRYVIRTLVDGKIVAGADNAEAARTWINKTGYSDAVNLDSNETIDPAVGGGGKGLPPSDPPKYPADLPWDHLYGDKYIGKANWGEDAFRMITNLKNWPLVMRYAEIMKDYDRKYGTKFYQSIFEPITQTRNERNFAARPYIDEIAKIQRNLASKPQIAELLAQYAETMTPEEVAAKFMSRPMNPTEIKTARNIAASNVDLENIFNYRNELKRLDRTIPPEERANDAAKQLDYQQQLEKTKEVYKIDQKHLDVVKILDAITEKPKNEISEGAVVRLARALNDGTGRRELSKAEFAKLHGLTPEHIAAANKMAALYSKGAKVFGIDEDRQLGGYITHAKLYFDGDIPKALRHFSGSTKTADFYAALTRTGEISSYETNMFKGALRYFKAGFDVHSGFSDALRAGRKFVEDELPKLPPDLQGQARNVLNRFINDVQGMPEAGDRAGQEAVHYLSDKWNLKLNDEVKRALATSTTSIINAGALGLRPMLGIGHLGISTGISIAARDVRYTSRMLANAGKALADRSIMEELQAKGVFQGLSPFSVFQPDINPSSIAGKTGHAIDVAQDAMFKATLLPTVYDGLAAGHYLTAYGDALDALTKFVRKEITGKELTKQTYLRRYDAAVQRRFLELAKTNVKDAAHYLGTQAVEDLVGTYGMGNTPYMWGTNAGRILGQFGNYAMWVRSSVQRMLTRGTIAERGMALTKLAAVWGLSKEASNELGIDLTRLSPLHAMTWMFGPLEHIADDAMTAARSTGYTHDQAMRRLGRVLPIDKDGNIHASIFIPGSYAIDGIVQAADQFSQGNAAAGALQVLGFRKYYAAKALGRGL